MNERDQTGAHEASAQTIMLIEHLRAERQRLQAEINRIVRDLQIQIENSHQPDGPGKADSPE